MQTTLKEHGILKLHLVDYFNHSTFSYKFLSFPNLRQRKTRDWENIYVVCDLKMTSCSFFFKPFLKRRSLPSLSWWKMKKISFPGGCSIFRSRIVFHFVLSNNFFTKREFTIHLFSPRGNKSCDVTVFPRLFRVTKKIPLYVAALFFSISRGKGGGEKNRNWQKIPRGVRTAEFREDYRESPAKRRWSEMGESGVFVCGQPGDRSAREFPLPLS